MGRPETEIVRRGEQTAHSEELLQLVSFNLDNVVVGAYLERDWGPKKFIECYLFCVIGAAVVTIAVACTHFLGMDPRTGTVGASGGICCR